VGGFFTWYLVLAVIPTAVMCATGLAALAGRADAGRYAAGVLAAAVALTAWVYTSSTPPSVAERISGPGARPAVQLAQVGWPLLSVAALLLLIGVVYAAGAGTSVRRAVLAVLSPLTVFGVVLSVGAGMVVATWWERGQVHPSTVEPVAVAPVPIVFGDSVAYTVRVADPINVVPAGPGFVVFEEGGGIRGYDGATGVQRWTIDPGVFPAGCGLETIRSTGIATDSVVIAECVRPRSLSPPLDTSNYNHVEPVLLGFDANTGQLLWLTDANFRLARGAGQSATVVAVTRGDDVASLDPRTGALRWVRKANDYPCDGVDVVTDDLVLDVCFNGTTLRVLDGMGGDERTIDLPVTAPASSYTSVQRVAADSGVLVLDVSMSRVGAEGGRTERRSTLAVDIDAGRITAVPSVTSGSHPRSPLPGPLLQLAYGGTPGQEWTEVYSLPERRLMKVQGVHAHSLAGDGQLWAQLGDRMVSAAADDAAGAFVASVAADGTFTRLPLPCPYRPEHRSRGAGVVPVPGATLVLCPPANEEFVGWDVLGMR
jgi:hypothetical protein